MKIAIKFFLYLFVFIPFFIKANEKIPILFFNVTTGTIIDETPEMKKLNQSIIKSLKGDEYVSILSSDNYIKIIEGIKCKTLECFGEEADDLESEYFVIPFIQQITDKEGDHLVLKLYHTQSLNFISEALTRVSSLDNLKEEAVNCFSNLIKKSHDKIVENIEKSSSAKIKVKRTVTMTISDKPSDNEFFSQPVKSRKTVKKEPEIKTVFDGKSEIIIIPLMANIPYQSMSQKKQNVPISKFNETNENEKKNRFNPEIIIKLWETFLKNYPDFKEKAMIEKRIEEYEKQLSAQIVYKNKYLNYMRNFEEDSETIIHYQKIKKVPLADKIRNAEAFTLKYFGFLGWNVFLQFNVERNSEIWSFLKDMSFSQKLWNQCKQGELEQCLAVAYLMLNSDSKETAVPYFENGCDNNIISACREQAKITNDKKLLLRACSGGDGEACFLLKNDSSMSNDEKKSLVIQACYLGYSEACKH